MDSVQKLRDEFNCWAEAGRGEEMEQHHRVITEPVLPLIGLQAGLRVLDLSCGAGWATRLLARRVAPGQAIGIDVSEEMLRRARAHSEGVSNIGFFQASATALPLGAETIDRILSVEAFYYFPDPDGALREMFRVLVPGGAIFIIINLYRDNPYSLRWVDALKVPVQVRSEAEYLSLLENHGFTNVEAVRVPDTSPTPETYSGKWFANAAELRAFKQIGALLLIGRKAGG